MKAVILAGGLSTRLSEEASTRPKTINVIFGVRPYLEREVMSPRRAELHIPGWRTEIDAHSGLTSLLNSQVALSA